VSISTDITGGGGQTEATRFLDMLSLMSNPEVYANKLKVLVDATEENKKYVELVAPASEIIALRKTVEDLKGQAQNTLAEASEEAASIKSKAKEEADALLASTKTDCANRTKKVVNAESALADKVKELNSKQKTLENLEKALSDKESDLASKLALVESMRAECDKDKAETENFRLSIIEKHSKFIESLK